MAEEPTAAGAGRRPAAPPPGAEPRGKTWPKWSKNGDVPEAVLQAWELVCRGYDNWALIARTLGFDVENERKKIKRDCIRYSKLLAATDGSGVDPRAEALTKYSRQEKELWKLYDQAGGMVDVEAQPDGSIVRTVHQRSQRLRLQSLRQLTELAERQAALKGVATRREVREHEEKTPPAPAVYHVTIAARQPEPDDD